MLILGEGPEGGTGTPLVKIPYTSDGSVDDDVDTSFLSTSWTVFPGRMAKPEPGKEQRRSKKRNMGAS